MGWHTVLLEDKNNFFFQWMRIFKQNFKHALYISICARRDKTLFSSIILKLDKVMPYYTQPQHVDAINLDVHSKNINSW